MIAMMKIMLQKNTKTKKIKKKEKSKIESMLWSFCR